MPKLISITEIKFVGPDWTGDERGYEWVEVVNSYELEAWRLYFESKRPLAQDQVKLCAEVGHDNPVGGCGVPRADGERQCAYFARRIEQDCWSPERQRLVKITIPAGDQ